MNPQSLTSEKSAITCATQRARQACTHCSLRVKTVFSLIPGNNLPRASRCKQDTMLAQSGRQLDAAPN